MKNTIISFAAACAYLQRDPELLPKVDHLPENEQRNTLAAFKVPIIVQAINQQFNDDKPWTADYDDSTQYKCWIWWRKEKSGFRFSYPDNVWSISDSAVGPRLSFINDDAAEVFGHTDEFVQLWNEMVTP